MKRQKILVLMLCLGLLVSLGLSGCNKSGSTPDEAETTPATEALATSSVASTAEIESKESQTEFYTEAESDVDFEDYYVPDYNADNYEEDKSDEPCTVNVDGKAYTCYIGDVINYVFYLKTPEALEDFQATTYYDSSMLRIVNANTAEMFPVAGEGVICNTDMQNTVKFNAVNLNGMDFTKGGSLISIKFEVLDWGSVAISTTLEYMDSVLSEPYVSDYKIVGDIEYSEKIIL